MSSRIAQWTLYVLDVPAMADFVRGYESHPDEGRSVHLRPRTGDGPTVWLQPVDAPKQGKLRSHIDLEADDPTTEVARLLALGARRTDVGQTGTEGFEVLSDPEGNEFCVLGVQRPGSTATDHHTRRPANRPSV